MSPRSSTTCSPTAFDRSAVALAAAVALVAAWMAFPSQATAQTCKPWQNGGEVTGKSESDELTESSGLAASRRHDGAFWTHNDSGHGPKLFLQRPDGSVVATAHVVGAKARDWEDIAIGPCSPTDGSKSTGHCIYVGEIGDNNRKHEEVRILKFPEPDVPDERSTSVRIENWHQIDFQYEDGPRNAEALMVHPRTAKMYVVEKNGSRTAPLYRIPNEPTARDERRTARLVTELPVAPGLGRQVTAGDIAPNGHEFSVRTYVKVYTFCADPEDPFTDTFSAEPVVSRPRLTIQSEALAYSPSGDHLWFTSEGTHPPMVRMDRAPSAGGSGGEESTGGSP